MENKKRPFTSDAYSCCHKWLSRNFIKLSKCEKCGGERFIEWALKKGKKHSHNRDDYLCLCSSCHKKYDYTLERRERLSASLKKVVHTDEWNKKVGQANTGRVSSEETKNKLREYAKKHPKNRNKTTGRFSG
jgi:hypothetical protein